jgi:hypothetical protein
MNSVRCMPIRCMPMRCMPMREIERVGATISKGWVLQIAGPYDLEPTFRKLNAGVNPIDDRSQPSVYI